MMTRQQAIDLLLDLSADNDAMRVGATAAVSEMLKRPAQPGDVGRGHELAFGAGLRILAAEIERGNIAWQTPASTPTESKQEQRPSDWPNCSAVANENDNFGRCLLPVGHEGDHLSEYGDAFTEAQASVPASREEQP